ncbi:hypothetical protein ARAM_007098 [Aspergillus rambellii]|uniref:Uncharacterized protein n=1 Tax=Aspergillus rambellii TaxID=308745 RepID=A0A0F8XCG7_9EURO|nr:hypothetical protein ARAM_007098 [Aspergillus rambellii]
MYVARKYRNDRLIFILIALELPFIIIILTFTGIASHNRYRTKLWQDGYDNGFNSSPDAAIYAAANYRPYTTPMVWSSFATNYNLVIAILSTFIFITKFPLHVLRILYPAPSAFFHAGLVAIYCASASFQAGSDTSDSRHLQRGAPWYIAKSCSVAYDKGNIGYCEQAKSLFAFTIVIIVLYFVEFVVAVYNCFITDEERAEREEALEEKRTMKEYEDMILKSPSFIPMTPRAVPMNPGTATYPLPAMPVMIPRSLAFNRLDTPSSSDLPLRETFSSPNPPPPAVQQEVEAASSVKQPQPQIYFPPPPKKALKK